MESEMLVKKIAKYAAKEVVTKRRHPVTTVKNIVKHKHDSRTKERVHHPDN
jgi:hypothetical protein